MLRKCVLGSLQALLLQVISVWLWKEINWYNKKKKKKKVVSMLHLKRCMLI